MEATDSPELIYTDPVFSSQPLCRDVRPAHCPQMNNQIITERGCLTVFPIQSKLNFSFGVRLFCPSLLERLACSKSKSRTMLILSDMNIFSNKL